VTVYTAELTPAVRAHYHVHFDSVPHSCLLHALLDQTLCSMLPFTTKATYDELISPFCLHSLMVRGFSSQHSWVGIVMSALSASDVSRILCRCSSPVTEDVPPRRDRSIHGVPPSVSGLVHSRSIPLYPTSVNGLVHSPSVHSVNTLHTYAHACMRTQLAISS
jgi:hypothetical protein